MQIVRKLYSFSIPTEDLVTIYQIYVRSILEQSSIVWHSSLTEAERTDLERVQKIALRIILKDLYFGYESALKKVGLETLDERREELCLSFAKSCTKTSNNGKMFPLNRTEIQTRTKEKYVVQHASTDRLKNSAIPYMQRLLNKHC